MATAVGILFVGGCTQVSRVGLLSDGNLDGRSLAGAPRGRVLQGEDCGMSYYLANAFRQATAGTEYDTDGGRGGDQHGIDVPLRPVPEGQGSGRSEQRPTGLGGHAMRHLAVAGALLTLTILGGCAAAPRPLRYVAVQQPETIPPAPAGPARTVEVSKTRVLPNIRLRSTPRRSSASSNRRLELRSSETPT